MFFAGAVAGIDDDAGSFPGLDETTAGLGIGELEDEVVEIAEVVEEGGGVDFDFSEEGAAVDDLAARAVEVLEGGDGRAEGGDADGGDATVGGSGFTGRQRSRSLTRSVLEKLTLPRRSRSPDFLKWTARARVRVKAQDSRVDSVEALASAAPPVAARALACLAEILPNFPVRRARSMPKSAGS